MDADSKGLVAAKNQTWWEDIILKKGFIHLDSHQLETAKQCFLRALSWPSAEEHSLGLQGMARYHRARKEWDKVTECCQEALTLILEVKKAASIGHTEERTLLLLAEAAEEEGDMERAR